MSEMNAQQQRATSTAMVSAGARQQQRDGEMEIDLGEMFLHTDQRHLDFVFCDADV